MVAGLPRGPGCLKLTCWLLLVAATATYSEARLRLSAQRLRLLHYELYDDGGANTKAHDEGRKDLATELATAMLKALCRVLSQAAGPATAAINPVVRTLNLVVAYASDDSLAEFVAALAACHTMLGADRSTTVAASLKHDAAFYELARPRVACTC